MGGAPRAGELANTFGNPACFSGGGSHAEPLGDSKDFGANQAEQHHEAKQSIHVESIRTDDSCFEYRLKP
jgi:hypothetical protein